MRALLESLLRWGKGIRPSKLGAMKDLAQGQAPEVLLIGCSDSRVALSTITDGLGPGEVFIVRNVGNLVPKATDEHADLSVAAALEFGIGSLGVGHLVVCGHADCGAMKGLYANKEDPCALHSDPSYVGKWLARTGVPSIERFNGGEQLAGWDKSVSDIARLSQLNALEQMENLRTYPIVAQAEKDNKLQLHAWYFDIGNGHMCVYDKGANAFAPLTEETARAMVPNLWDKESGN